MTVEYMTLNKIRFISKSIENIFVQKFVYENRDISFENEKDFFIKYLNNEYPLTGLNNLIELNGLYFNELPTIFQNRYIEYLECEKILDL